MCEGPWVDLQVLILSYETFRLHADKFKGEGACDLLICDEAHRLKNEQTLTNKARAPLIANLMSHMPLTADSHRCPSHSLSTHGELLWILCNLAVQDSSITPIIIMTHCFVQPTGNSSSTAVQSKLSLHKTCLAQKPTVC
jgi:hypothetical protein